jgi:predicted enzyme related to lactoylglutathione lyase
VSANADRVREGAGVLRLTRLGGEARPAFDIMDQGRMAVCIDPNGAEFDVWEPRKGLGTDADSGQHGAPSWFEALTTDTGRAAQFYAQLFGWTPEPQSLPGVEYATFRLGPTYVAGMMLITPTERQRVAARVAPTSHREGAPW